MNDVIVIGGGPAGLQAALTLGRMHRDVLLLDSGSYRNDPAAHLHNFLSQDGTPPAELRAQAREDLSAYPTVVVRDVAATAVATDGDGFVVTTVDGDHHAQRVVLATGVRDVLPDIPGLASLFGSTVAHCPFCHGHEFAGLRVGVQAGPHADRLALMMRPVAAEVVVLDDVTALEPHENGVRVRLRDGSGVDVGGFFVAPTFEQAAPFAAQLGLALLPSGGIEVDAYGRTSLPGVYAAGDLAHSAALPMPMASVLAAAAAGQLAGATCVADEVMAATAAAAS